METAYIEKLLQWRGCSLFSCSFPIFVVTLAVFFSLLLLGCIFSIESGLIQQFLFTNQSIKYTQTWALLGSKYFTSLFFVYFCRKHWYVMDWGKKAEEMTVLLSTETVIKLRQTDIRTPVCLCVCVE